MNSDRTADAECPVRLALAVMKTGFSCTACGSCCGDDGDDIWAVFMSATEVHRIEAALGRPRDSFAIPYHETVDFGRGTTGTFGWAIRQKNGRCIFQDGKRCSIYPFRPWICRTYPFFMNGRETACDQCPGTGRPMTFEEALYVAFGLIRRREEENADESAIREILAMKGIPDNSRVLVDSSGVTVLNG